MDRNSKKVVIIGGGITGASYAQVLAHYTNIKSIVVLEAGPELGGINTHSHNNSQTLHTGDIETNYSEEKAANVKRATDLLVTYMEKNAPQAYTVGPKMILAVGTAEVAELSYRFEKIKHLYPGLRPIGRGEVMKLEPHVIIDRDPLEPVLALVNHGHTVDFQAVAKSFIDHAQKSPHAQVDIYINSKVSLVEQLSASGNYKIETINGDVFYADVVIFAAGAHSLMYAKKLGYGKHLSILPVAGSFYYAQGANLLNGKVYTMQKPKLPFAAVHGDPEFSDPTTTRFGPTAKVLPMFIRHSYSTVWDFFKTNVWTWRGFAAKFNVLFDGVLFKYILKNIGYDLPYIGKYFFLVTARKIIPSLRYGDIAYAPKYGGIRPQLLNTRTGTLEMGDARIIGDNAIFEITPSPGASVCLQNAYEGAQEVCKFLNIPFDHEKWREDYQWKFIPMEIPGEVQAQN